MLRVCHNAMCLAGVCERPHQHIRCPARECDAQVHAAGGGGPGLPA